MRKYWVEADCSKEMPTHSTMSATAMSSSMASYTVSGVITSSARQQVQRVTSALRPSDHTQARATCHLNQNDMRREKDKSLTMVSR